MNTGRLTTRSGGSGAFLRALRFSLRALAPTIVLLLAAETTIRLKYFFAHDHEWNYLIAPFVRGRFGARELWEAPTPESNQTEFNWPKACVDRMVYSAALQKEMPRTFDEHCFRGDRVVRQKPADEYRIMFLGGSTVEDAQSDSETMTEQFKRSTPSVYNGKRVTVVNAGKAGFESARIWRYWDSWVGSFSPDLVLYYEAINEQPSDAKWTLADQRLTDVRNRLHRVLYYRSMLYTYLLEKSAFLSASNARFWKVDLERLRDNFTMLARDVKTKGARFVFVTQIVRFPRIWKGVDTFDRTAVDALLDRLRADPQYVYNVDEISALNQRLALFYTLELCRDNDVPAINILEPMDALGDEKRAELFIDLPHLSVRGDRVVGELIASRLPLLR